MLVLVLLCCSYIFYYYLMYSRFVVQPGFGFVPFGLLQLFPNHMNLIVGTIDVYLVRFFYVMFYCSCIVYFVFNIYVYSILFL